MDSDSQTICQSYQDYTYVTSGESDRTFVNISYSNMKYMLVYFSLNNDNKMTMKFRIFVESHFIHGYNMVLVVQHLLTLPVIHIYIITSY